MHSFDNNAMILVVLPVIGLLASVVFRVDEYAFSSSRKSSTEPRARFANFDAEKAVMTDPDGKIPERPHKRQPRQLLRDRVKVARSLDQVHATGSLTIQR